LRCALSDPRFPSISRRSDGRSDREEGQTIPAILGMAVAQRIVRSCPHSKSGEVVTMKAQFYKYPVVLCCLWLAGCASPILDKDGRARFEVMSEQALSLSPAVQTFSELRVSSALVTSTELMLRLTPELQSYEFETGKSLVHLMSLPEETREYELEVNLMDDSSVLGVLPTAIVLDREYQEISRVELLPEDFKIAAGTTIFQYVAIDRNARFVLFHVRKSDVGKEYKLGVDVGIAAYSYRRVVSPLGSFRVKAIKRGCRIFNCPLPVQTP
jgi:hypothetical protein